MTQFPRRASLPATTEDDLYTVSTPQIRRRWDTGQDAVITRGNQRIIVHQGPPPKRRLPHLHPLVWIIGTFLVVWLLVQAMGVWNSWQDSIHYGYPRISQMDAVVGHNDSSTNETHFLFLNLHGHVQIIEIPGGDASKERVFTGPTLIGAGQDLIPVTGEIRNEDGRLDLIVHIQDQQIVYVNDGSTFKEQQQ
jgi:hypothetical protein